LILTQLAANADISPHVMLDLLIAETENALIELQFAMESEIVTQALMKGIKFMIVCCYDCSS